AYNIILEHVRSDSPAWAVLGEKVCLQAWKVLRGLGSKRFNRLKAHAQNGLPSPPVDTRYLKRPKSREVNESRASIVSFLTEVYHSIAETLPDFRDQPCDIDAPNIISVVAGDEHLDPYAEHLEKDHAATFGEPSANVEPNVTSPKKKRKMHKSVAINPARQSGCETHEEKWLPPGQMKDYWRLYKKKCGDGPVAHFATFWRVWLSEFSFLKFRQMRQHPECSTCVRHKCLIRGLGHHIHARVKQEEMYQERLHAQYLDRIQYWSTRGLSRSCSGELCVILDGMDQGKFAFPRHPSMHSKEFAGFTRPRAHVIGAIVHGRSIIYAITEPDLPKNATTHIEFLAYILTLVSEQEDLATLALRLQCDNTSRECKNNIMLAFLISMVSKGVLREASISSLRSGHSHEDIDQGFGRLAKYMTTHGRNCLTPNDFVGVIQKFLSQAHYPFEAGRQAVKIDQTRDWLFGWCSVALLFLFVS
ncbi:unnamed protein product, partial [Durusdinium trenchii]